ncbi:ApeA N-terminal domain 1-containing protein [Chryseobacterium taiwanense]|uniref:Uncharacterized protein n=1 Tax=Chryseobacterium taiwanense TaxID=363331 RepID=A0A0B4D1S8_9FLAO|nr:HEPN domain-containing protein [Chryseobacterium taiwanense]KIC62582.1 hypothetical protein RM51_12015 [Chryseobacterium taiwanense]
MTKNFELKGEWFLPSNKTKRISGSLIYDIDKGITLKLHGNFNDFPNLSDKSDNQYDIILGLTSKSEEITLYNIFLSFSEGIRLVQNQEVGTPSSEYIVNYIFRGAHFNTQEDIKFDQLVTEISDLEEWVGISGFIKDFDFIKKIEMQKNHEFKLDYKLPSTINFPLSENLDGQFNFVMIPSSEAIHYQKQFLITQRTELILKYKEEKNIEDILNDLFIFQSFLILGLYEKSHPKSITFYNEKNKKNYGNDNIVKREVKLYFHISDQKIEKQKTFRDMLFSYGNIEDKFPELIQNWFKKYNKLESCFKLLIEQFYNEKRFSENTFLNLAQAAESFHAHTKDRPKMPKEEYTEMKNEILSKVDSKYHTWLKDQFNFGNHLNLQTRLEELLTFCSCDMIDKIIGNKNEFIKNVKNSRNYYTHYSLSLKKKAIKGSELFYLTQKLKIILVSAFLIELGFDKNILNQILEEKEHRFFHFLTKL